MPCIYVLNKIDAITIEELDLISEIPHHGLGRPRRLRARSVFHIKSVFVRRVCEGAQRAYRPKTAAPGPRSPHLRARHVEH
jgi:hypothetical protein